MTSRRALRYASPNSSGVSRSFKNRRVSNTSDGEEPQPRSCPATTVATPACPMVVERLRMRWGAGGHWNGIVHCIPRYSAQPETKYFPATGCGLRSPSPTAFGSSRRDVVRSVSRVRWVIETGASHRTATIVRVEGFEHELPFSCRRWRSGFTSSSIMTKALVRLGPRTRSEVDYPTARALPV